MLMAKIEKKGFIFICFLFGVMIAIQINSLKQETEIESRSTWQLRENLTNAMKTETKLLQEIQEIDELIAQYETEKVQSGKTILTDTLKELRLEAGLEEWEGPGITITVTRAEELLWRRFIHIFHHRYFTS